MHVQQGQQSYTGGSLHGKGRQHSSCCHGPRLPGGVAGDHRPPALVEQDCPLLFPPSQAKQVPWLPRPLSQAMQVPLLRCPAGQAEQVLDVEVA